MTQSTDLDTARHLEELEQTITTSLKQAQDCCNQANQIVEEGQSLAQQFNQDKDELNSIKSQFQDVQHSIESQFQDVQQQISRVNQLSYDADSKLEQVQELYEKISNVASEIGNKEQFESFLEEVNEVKEQLKQANSQLTVTRNDFYTQHQQLNENLVVVEEQFNQISEERHQIEQLSQDVSEKVSFVETATENIQQLADQTESNIQQQQQDIEVKSQAFQEQREETIQTLNSIQKQVREESNTIHEITRNIEQSEQFVSQERFKCEDVTANLEGHLSQVQNLVNQVSEDKTLILEKVQTFTQIKQELENIQRLIGSTINEIGGQEGLETIRQEYNQVMESLQSTQTALQSSQKQVEETAQEAKSERKLTTQFKSQIEAQQTDLRNQQDKEMSYYRERIQQLEKRQTIFLYSAIGVVTLLIILILL